MPTRHFQLEIAAADSDLGRFELVIEMRGVTDNVIARHELRRKRCSSESEGFG